MWVLTLFFPSLFKGTNLNCILFSFFSNCFPVSDDLGSISFSNHLHMQFIFLIFCMSDN